MIDEVIAGRYRHFRTGNEYIVTGTVLDTDTDTVKVLYHSVYGDMYCRSVESWNELVEDTLGNIVVRFTRIGD